MTVYELQINIPHPPHVHLKRNYWVMGPTYWKTQHFTFVGDSIWTCLWNYWMMGPTYWKTKHINYVGYILLVLTCVLCRHTRFSVPSIWYRCQNSHSKTKGPPKAMYKDETAFCYGTAAKIPILKPKALPKLCTQMKLCNRITVNCRTSLIAYNFPAQNIFYWNSVKMALLFAYL